MQSSPTSVHLLSPKYLTLISRNYYFVTWGPQLPKWKSTVVDSLQDPILCTPNIKYSPYDYFIQLLSNHFLSAQVAAAVFKSKDLTCHPEWCGFDTPKNQTNIMLLNLEGYHHDDYANFWQPNGTVALLQLRQMKRDRNTTIIWKG